MTELYLVKPTTEDSEMLTALDYSDFTLAEQTMLRTAEAAITADLTTAGDAIIRAGHRLAEVQAELTRNGKKEGFRQWCLSGDCPVRSYQQALDMIAIGKEFGCDPGSPPKILGPRGPGVKALGKLFRLEDEQKKLAIKAHIVEQIEAGEKITKADYLELKKTLDQVDQLEEKTRDQEEQLDEYRRALQRAKEERDEQRKKKDTYCTDLIEADKARRLQEESAAKELEEARRETVEYYREQMEEQAKKIRDEERSRPRTTKDEEAKKARVAKLKEELKELKDAKHYADIERNEALADMRKAKLELHLYDKAIGNFGETAHRWQTDVHALIGSVSALSSTPMTEGLRRHIETLIGLTEHLTNELKTQLQAPEYIDAEVIDGN